MGSDEPFASIFLRHGALNVFQIVVCWKIQRIATGDIVIDQRVILNDTKLLSRIESIALSITIELFIR